VLPGLLRIFYLGKSAVLNGESKKDPSGILKLLPFSNKKPILQFQ